MLENRVRILVLALFLTLCAIYPACPLLFPGNVEITPQGDALPGETLANASAAIEIVPSGATTFSETHTLSLSTGLMDAGWQVVVVVDGRQAAVIPGEGPQVFVNGFLLSYPTTRDVGVQIFVNGRVPPNPAQGTVVVLEWRELNGQGQPVAGSGYQVTRKVTLSPPSPMVTRTNQPPVPVASPTKAPFPVIAAIVSTSLVFAWVSTRKR